MALKHIVLDCDGVLWDGTNDGYFVCYHAAARAAGIPLAFELAKERILQNWGRSAQLEVECMLPEHPERVAEVLQHYQGLIRSDLFLSTAKAIAGVQGAVRRLAESYTLSAISGMNAENLETLFARFQLRSCFRHVFSTSENNDPAQQKCTGFHLGKVLKSEGLSPQEAICVGDALVDFQMAASCQVPFVAVLTGHLTEPVARELGARAILPSLAHLPGWLELPALMPTR